MIRHLGLCAIALAAGVNMAAAQAPADSHNDQAKPAQNGAEEPAVRQPAPATSAVFVDGKLAVPGAPDDSQTVPSKVSERNAGLDATPIMALPLGLSDDQKRQIMESIASSSIPISQISAKPADILPMATPVSEFPAEIKKQIPILGDIGIIRTKDRILLVRAPNMVVTGAISTN